MLTVLSDRLDLLNLDTFVVLKDFAVGSEIYHLIRGRVFSIRLRFKFEVIVWR